MGERRIDMKMYNTTTKEFDELTYIDPATGIDCAQDIIGNTGALNYNREFDRFEMSADDIAWWDEYLTNSHADAETAADLISQYGDPAREIIEDALDGVEMSDEHAAYQQAFAEIAATLK